MKIRNSACLVITFFVLLSMTIPVSANVSIVRDKTTLDADKLNPQNSINGTNATYEGSIKVHVVEPISRWKDLTGHAYDNAHLSYPLLADLNIADATIWDTTITWNGSSVGFGNVTIDNIATAVAVFTSNYEICDAYPPNSFLYYAYYADASAMARPDEPGMNQTAPGFTHSVYVEEGTATW